MQNNQKDNSEILTIKRGAFGIPRGASVGLGIILIIGSRSGFFEDTDCGSSHAGIGVFFIIIGIIFMLRQTTITIDKGRKTFRLHKGFQGLFDNYNVEYKSSDIKSVCMEQISKRDENYSILLNGLTPPFLVGRYQFFERTLVQAKSIANALGVELHVKAKERNITYTPEQLAQSPKERMSAALNDNPPPEANRGRIQLKGYGDKLTFTLPPRGCGENFISLLKVTLVVAGLFSIGYHWLNITIDESATLYISIAITILTIFSVGLTLVNSLNRHTDSITISPEGINLVKKDIYGKINKTIPIEEIEEIALSYEPRIGRRGHILAIRSKDTTLQFGYGLSDEELIWLRDTLHQHVATKILAKLKTHRPT